MTTDARTRTRGWIDSARATRVPDVAAELGFSVQGSGISPCPACQANKRHPKRRDRRGAVGLVPGGTGWRCFECNGGGDALDFVAFALAGARLRELPAVRVDDVREWYASRGWCHTGGGAGEVRGSSLTPRARAGIPRTTPEPAHPRPPMGEVAALWSACKAVTDDPDVAAWLAGRRLDAGHVADRDLARALPRSLDVLPSWAACRGRAWTHGWRLLLPLYDAAGRMTSLRARLVRDPDGPGEPKSSAAAAGPGSSTGLVMADGLGRQILACGCAPRWWDGAALRLFVAEGEPDYLALATVRSDADDDAPAVLGIVVGAWTPEIARRIAAGAVVTIATHADAAGERYARKVAAMLGGRCNVQRWRAPGVA